MYPAAEADLLRKQATGDPALLVVEPWALNANIRTWLDERVSASWTDQRKVQTLHRLLFDETGLGLIYDPEKTLTAEETFSSRRGNCLSVTNLFIGLARYLHLDAGFQRATLVTEWDQQADLMIRYEHINARGRLQNGKEYVVDFLPQLAVKTGSEARLVEDAQGRALYFSNLGVEALLQGDPELALEQLRFAIAVYPGLADAWVNLGTVFRRMQRTDLAEYSFHEALRLEAIHQTAMGNLASLYQQLGEEERAASFYRRLTRVRNRNPYYHFIHWRQAFDEGRFRESLEHLSKAIMRKGREAEFFFALEETLLQLGERQAAMNAARHAETLLSETGQPKIRDAQLLLYDSPDSGIKVRIRSGGFRQGRQS